MIKLVQYAVVFEPFEEEGLEYVKQGCGDRWCNMDDDDVKQQALEQAQQAYGLFIWFVKWFSYIMITLIVIMFMNNWFDDGTGSMFMPDEIYEDQYDPQGLNKKKGI
jgi:hypothetical protein